MAALDTERPFLSFYTPTFRRPKLLARCQVSVGSQTIPCEQVVIRDEVGIGIEGMFEAIPTHAHKLTGEYVHVLTDDDVLAGPTVAESVQRVALEQGYPDVLVVRVIKRLPGILHPILLPLHGGGPPIERTIDLGCIITRRDVWLAHVHDYGRPDGQGGRTYRYEADYDHMRAMWDAGRRFVYTDILFQTGAAMQGRPE